MIEMGVRNNGGVCELIRADEISLCGFKFVSSLLQWYDDDDDREVLGKEISNISLLHCFALASNDFEDSNDNDDDDDNDATNDEDDDYCYEYDYDD